MIQELVMATWMGTERKRRPWKVRKPRDHEAT